MKNYCPNAEILTCDCCVESLANVIAHEFTNGDIIGLTYIEQGVASIAHGTFRRLLGSVVVVDNLLLPGTTSYVPLRDVSSVEKGIAPEQTNNGPISVALNM